MSCRSFCFRLMLASAASVLMPWPCYPQTAETPPLKLERLQLGFSFPDIRNVAGKELLVRTCRDLDADLLRFSIDWKFVERGRGQYTWRKTDEFIDWAHKHKLQLLLTIRTDGPDWTVSERSRKGANIRAENLPDFGRFAEAVIRRYGAKIAKLQFGNEWAVDHHFPGTGAQYVRMSNMVYDALKRHHPDVPFVLGGLSTAALRALAVRDGSLRAPADLLRRPKTQNIFRKADHVLANAKYDMIDLHLYFNIDEWPALVDSVADRKNKPLIVSEWGAVNAMRLQRRGLEFDYDFHAESIKEALQMLSELDIAEAYHFKLRLADARNPRFKYCGILTPEGQQTKAYDHFKEFSRR